MGEGKTGDGRVGNLGGLSPSIAVW